MKLPEEMPLELNSKILSVVHGCECEDCHSLLTAHYKLIAYYFNNLPVDWRPVSEKPEKDSDVWLWDGKQVIKGTSILFPQEYGLSTYPGYEDICIDDNFEPTRWAYCNIPEPPKE